MASKRKSKRTATTADIEEEHAEVNTVRPNDPASPTKEAAWKNPTIEEKTLRKLVKDGFLPDQAIVGWKLPGEHCRPYLGTTEIVMWPAFIERGLMLPSSDFFRGFLHFYELTMNHLTANAVLQLSIFVHLYEAFLGVPPLIMLFRYFFWVKA